MRSKGHEAEVAGTGYCEPGSRALQLEADVETLASRLRYAGQFESLGIAVVEVGFGIDVGDVAVDEPQVATHHRDRRHFDGGAAEDGLRQAVAELHLTELDEAGVVDELLSNLPRDPAVVGFRKRLDRVGITRFINSCADETSICGIPGCITFGP